MNPWMKLRPECEELLRRFGVPAVGLARIGVAGVESLGVLGERKRGSGVAVTENDLWHIGSCGKSMTATLMARLVECGQLEWDAPVAPLFAAHGVEAHPDFAGLTLRHLLTHRSGMPADPSPAELEVSYSSTLPPRLQRAALAREAMMRRPEQKPGEAFCYSSIGYTIAGALAEAVTGAAWEDLMRREVFLPLGLATAGFGAPGHDQGSNDALTQPWGHQGSRWSFSALRPNDAQADNPPLIGPAGTVHLSLPDLARYLAFHISGGATAPGYLRPETVKVMHTPRRGEEEAFGWFLSQPEANGIGKPMLWHDGTNYAWYAAVLMVPEDRRGLAFVCNAYRDSLADPETGVMDALAKIYNNWRSAMA
jgi:CubicO group peptidase (beta-lactamase class C family)